MRIGASFGARLGQATICISYFDRLAAERRLFVVGPGPQPSLVVRDAQHEYVFAGDGKRAPAN